MNKNDKWFWMWTISLIINLYNAFYSDGWSKALSVFFIALAIVCMIKSNDAEKKI